MTVAIDEPNRTSSFKKHAAHCCRVSPHCGLHSAIEEMKLILKWPAVKLVAIVAGVAYTVTYSL